MAPEIDALTHDNRRLRLSDFRGKQCVVLVFYPGDSTPLCTSQLCGFRDTWAQLERADTLVLGINPSNQAKHAQFVEKNNFPFPLLVDTKSSIAQAYGRSALFGLFIRRAVFLIDKQGKIAQIWEGNPAPERVLEAIEALE
jgi:peroxiredoxin Q/BCP